MAPALAAATAIAGLISAGVGVKQAFSKPKGAPTSAAPTTPSDTAAGGGLSEDQKRANVATRYGLLSTGPQGLQDQPSLGRFKLLGN